MTIEEPPKKKLLDRVRDAIRLKHYSYRTEETYVQWIKRYIFFHNKRHPQEMGVATNSSSRARRDRVNHKLSKCKVGIPL